MGVFATRSPFRPNPLGLSCVEVERIEMNTPDGPVIVVKGADMMDGTPIYDLKPYVRYADSHPDSVCGYVDSLKEKRLSVLVPEHLESSFEPDFLRALTEVLSLDPRPSYHDDPHREYGMTFHGRNVRFTVQADQLKVHDIE